MADRSSIVVLTLLAMLGIFITGAMAFDDARYPDLKGQWTRTGDARWDPSKPRGAGQQAPLTPEYQAIHKAAMADEAAGGQGTDPTYTCLPPGMPRVMTVYEPMEIVVTPDTTYLLIDHIHDTRRIFTDGREWPAEIEPSFSGYSIGRWVDTGGDGRYDVLEVETRSIKGPRVFDSTGTPLHRDNQTLVKERIFLDEHDPNLLHDQITTIDHALTRPWTVTKNYRRSRERQPVWRETVCTENNNHVVIANDSYFLSAEGYLMPARKDQGPPDLRYFKQPRR